MSEFDDDQSRILSGYEPNQTVSTTSNSRRPSRLFVGRSRRPTNNVDKNESNVDCEKTLTQTKYGYLEHILSYRDLCKPNDKSLKKNVRKFYEDQLALINSIESILDPERDEKEAEQILRRKHEERMIHLLTVVTLITNIVLVIIKIIAAVISKSLAVISSVVDSVVDLLTSIMLLWADHKIKHRDHYLYPSGRTRLEPIVIIILSVVMCSASVQVIFESGATLVQDVEYFTHPQNDSSTKTLPEINMSILPIVAMVLTIVSKTILLVACARYKNPTMDALAEDNRNDVASNIVALACGFIGSYALRQKIKQEAIVLDPVGGIIISIYIIVAWFRKANEQVRYLSGLSGEPLFLQRITHVVYNYRPDIVTKIDSVRAVHHGTKYLTEVDIGLPGSMPLTNAHDIGAELQSKLEHIDEIERAYVHLDFEFTHMPHSEHQVV